MKNNLTNFSKYGKNFQEKLVQLILFDRSFSNQIEEVLDLQFLEFKYLQSFVEVIYDYKKKYKVHPTLEIIRTIVGTQFSQDKDPVAKQLSNFVEMTNLDFDQVEEKEYIKDQALNFCRKQRVQETILKVVPLLKSASFEEIQSLLGAALKLGTDMNQGHDYIEDFEKRYSHNARKSIPTGWDEIDKITKGGFGKKELHVLIAITGGGKSMALVNVASAALKAGKNVVYYTLELSEEIVGNRFDACITGVPLDDLHKEKGQILSTIKDIPGRLVIKEYPSKRATPKTIENHINRMTQNGFKPDLVIVDYADLLRAGSSAKDFRPKALEEMYEELRAIGQINECVMVTASQTNRTGVNAEVVSMDSIADAFAKCFPADFICTISGKGKMFIAKNRNGIDGLVLGVETDFSRCKINVTAPKDNSLDLEDLIHSAKDKKNGLAEKYQTFIKNK